jgi:hypothetical protein
MWKRKQQLSIIKLSLSTICDRFMCLEQPGEEPAALLCSQCKDSFHSAWDLMVHVQAAHMLNIYQLSVDPNTAPKDHSAVSRHLSYFFTKLSLSYMMQNVELEREISCSEKTLEEI